MRTVVKRRDVNTMLTVSESEPAAILHKAGSNRFTPTEFEGKIKRVLSNLSSAHLGLSSRTDRRSVLRDPSFSNNVAFAGKIPAKMLRKAASGHRQHKRHAGYTVPTTISTLLSWEPVSR